MRSPSPLLYIYITHRSWMDACSHVWLRTQRQIRQPACRLFFKKDRFIEKPDTVYRLEGNINCLFGEWRPSLKLFWLFYTQKWKKKWKIEKWEKWEKWIHWKVSTRQKKNPLEGMIVACCIVWKPEPGFMFSRFTFFSFLQMISIVLLLDDILYETRSQSGSK